jgi:hypothetical protein
MRQAEGGAKTFGVFRVKNHDFTPKNLIFSNCGGRRGNFWGIPSEKSQFYAKKKSMRPPWVPFRWVKVAGRPDGAVLNNHSLHHNFIFFYTKMMY